MIYLEVNALSECIIGIYLHEFTNNEQENSIPQEAADCGIGGFYATQISLFITQAKNKIAYHSINWAKKLKYRRRVINKQRAKVSGMCDTPNSSYSLKGITENYSV